VTIRKRGGYHENGDDAKYLYHGNDSVEDADDERHLPKSIVVIHMVNDCILECVGLDTGQMLGTLSGNQAYRTARKKAL
jgi:hypothetical protein